jgi:trehalose 6-phosphate phosphatase
MVSPELELALTHFAHSPRALIALDFDGTLAPLGDDPTLSRMIPEARAALEALTELPGVFIALVTGRAIESIQEVGEPMPQWYLVGSHGIEVVSPTERERYSSPNLVPAALAESFEALIARYPGTRLEMKPFGVALHTRGVPPETALAAETAAHRLWLDWKEHEGGALVVLTGHGIVECAVREATKGDGIVALREAVGATSVLFAGDDKTDEDGLRVLGSGDVAIRVGGGDTVAAYRLDNAEAVARALWHICKVRSTQ